MSNKKNLPNIPIYIGDWERDCNVLSVESEGAWLRICFKLWTKGKQNSIKIPTKSVQNLWRCSPEKMREILDDLIYNEIGEIIETDGFIEFTCRRYVKENSISKIRSDAGKGNKKTNKKESKLKQNKNKKEQNSEIEIENENEYNNVNEVENKKMKNEKTKIIFPFDNENFRTQWQHWKVYKDKELKFKYKTIQSEQAALNDLANKSNGDEKTAIAIMHQSMANGWKGFFELKNKTNAINKGFEADNDYHKKVYESEIANTWNK